MLHFIARALTRVPLLALGGFATIAAAAPVSINSEQKAAGAVLTANNFAHNALGHHWALLERTVFFANRALQTASSVTTPSALMATPAGVVVPCAVSGSMTARLAPRFPRVFKFEWRNCNFTLDGTQAMLDGPGEIVLLSDDFAPKNVASIRFGSADRDLVLTQDIAFPSIAFHHGYLRNLRLTGIIPLAISPYAIANASNQFAYVASGFVDHETRNDFPGTDQPSQEFGERLEVELVTYAGRYSYNEDATRYDEDVSALFGKLTFTTRNPPPYGTASEVARFDGFRVHQLTDYNDLTKTLSIDGRLDYTWNPNFGAGCVNGGYQFRTRTPLHGLAFAFPEYDAGELTINGTQRTTFYSAASVPPGLPVPASGMLIHNDVQGLGTFNYDAQSVTEALRSTAHCM